MSEPVSTDRVYRHTVQALQIASGELQHHLEQNPGGGKNVVVPRELMVRIRSRIDELGAGVPREPAGEERLDLAGAETWHTSDEPPAEPARRGDYRIEIEGEGYHHNEPYANGDADVIARNALQRLRKAGHTIRLARGQFPGPSGLFLEDLAAPRQVGAAAVDGDMTPLNVVREPAPAPVEGLNPSTPGE